MGFPDGSADKESAWMQETQVQSPGRDDSLEKGIATIPVFLLKNRMDRGAWWATV